MSSMAMLIMGSESDLEEAFRIEERLVGFHVDVKRHILSAHRNTIEVLDTVFAADKEHSPLVYVACAGKKPDLGPVIAGNTDNPVVAYVKKTDPDAFYTHHLLSSLDTPPGISLAVFTDPANTALYVAKIIGTWDAGVREASQAYRISRAMSNIISNTTYGRMTTGELGGQLGKR
ncbi:MAG: AIR carboxylase family protein [Candidatus Aenigmarchaeota archaeon]|nr:AIR carboxylase family protein [Candidatus Aenigmarchaeota archaeon]